MKNALRPSKKTFLLYLLPVTVIYCFTVIVPIFYSVFYSLFQWKGGPKKIFIGLENYVRLLGDSDMPKYLLNSLRTTGISLVFIVLGGFVIGYFLARFRFRGSKLLSLLYTIGLLLPIHAIIVPMYIQFNQFGLTNQWYTLIIPYVAFGLPIGVFLTSSYVRSIPKEMEEAAALDGCSFSRTLFQIILPMCRPILTTVAIIQFFTCWNEFVFALILVNDAYMTIPVGMTLFKGQFTAEYPVMMTTMVLGMLPALIIYFALSKHIINGMVAGAVKG